MPTKGRTSLARPWCKVWETLGQQPDSSSPSSGQGSASPGLTVSPGHDYGSSQNLHWPHFSHRHERTSRIPAAPKVHSLTAEMQHDSWHSLRTRQESWETPPFQHHQMPEGAQHCSAFPALSPTPGLALRERSVCWGQAAPRANTIPSENSALAFLQPVQEHKVTPAVWPLLALKIKDRANKT